MRKVLFFISVVLVATSIVGCNGKSEKDIEALAQAKYQHIIDSMKLAEAEAKLDQQGGSSEVSAPAESRHEEAKETSSSQAPAPVNHESHEPQYSDQPVSSYHGAAYGTEYDWLSDRYATYDDLAGLSSWDLCVLRNSMYARRGRKFKRADLREFFNQFEWYVPRYDEVKLSSIESTNVKFIKQFE